MGMSDELTRKMDKRSKEEKKEVADRIVAEKISQMGKNHRKDPGGVLSRIWDVVRKWIGHRNPE
jgi:hypothetical protein